MSFQHWVITKNETQAQDVLMPNKINLFNSYTTDWCKNSYTCSLMLLIYTFAPCTNSDSG